MSSINSVDRIKIEKFLQMEAGYVCDFNDATFKGFILEYTGVDVYVDEYAKNGTSKANRLRYFFKKESDYLNSKLLGYMLEYWKTKIRTPYGQYRGFDRDLHGECLSIVSKLRDSSQIDGVEKLPSFSSNKDFAVLLGSIREDLRKNNHEYILDRLHTYVAMYIGELCNKHSILYAKNMPLHSRFGKYVKFLRDKELIESKMSENILSSTIKILDDFNVVRNDKSFAHHNEIINHAEGVLIVNNIIHGILFVQALERLIDEKTQKDKDKSIEEESDIPSQDEIDAAGDWYLEQLSEIARGK